VYASAMAAKTYEYHDSKGKLHKTYATADQHEYLVRHTTAKIGRLPLRRQGNDVRPDRNRVGLDVGGA
jgi:hypothetical protein